MTPEERAQYCASVLQEVTAGIVGMGATHEAVVSVLLDVAIEQAIQQRGALFAIGMLERATETLKSTRLMH